MRWMIMLTVAALLLPVSGASGQKFRSVALTGTPAPGIPNAGTFTSFLNRPVINSAGEVAFRAQSIAGEGIWAERAGNSLALVAGRNAAAPGTGGFTFRGFRDPLLDDNNHTSFFGVLTGAASDSDSGLWGEGPGNALSLIVREGGLVPGDFALSSSGYMAYQQSFGAGNTATNNSIVRRSAAGSSGIVVREGTQAPGMQAGVVFADTIGFPAIVDSGTVAFYSGLSGTGVMTDNDQAIWLAPVGGDPQLIVRTGSVAPGLAGGGTLTRFSASIGGFAVLNDSGQLAFDADIRGASGDASMYRGMFVYDGGAMHLVARDAQQAPGTPSGVTFTGLEDPVLNAAGHVAFRSTIFGPGINQTNFVGIWSQRPSGELELAAKGGDRAPGMPDGVLFSSANNGGFGPPTMNATGQTAFIGYLSGPGISGANGSGVWAQDLDGTLRLVVRAGDLLEVAPGDFRRMDGFDFFRTMFTGSGNQDGSPSSFNDLGQLALTIGFTDGSSGVFVFNTAGVPEPTLFGLLAIAAFAMTSCRPFRREIAVVAVRVGAMAR